MLVVLVDIHVKAGSSEAFKEATLANARASLHEAGIARFDLLERQDDPERFVLVEAYRSPEAQASHKQTAHYAAWAESVAPMMAEPRTSARFQEILPGAQAC
ncbi:MAG TPA: antibiotic biosynthesis monooxygenase [Holophaga sp.]|nr:antibiotic biosynthesis monooxygenase [Holophaga sp.]